jgi:hypothetical protein
MPGLMGDEFHFPVLYYLPKGEASLSPVKQKNSDDNRWLSISG